VARLSASPTWSPVFDFSPIVVVEAIENNQWDGIAESRFTAAAKEVSMALRRTGGKVLSTTLKKEEWKRRLKYAQDLGRGNAGGQLWTCGVRSLRSRAESEDCCQHVANINSVGAYLRLHR
jgi:hypothetical protein